MLITVILTLIMCMLGFIGVIVYGGWDGVQRGYTFTQFFVWHC